MQPSPTTETMGPFFPSCVVSSRFAVASGLWIRRLPAHTVYATMDRKQDVPSAIEAGLAIRVRAKHVSDASWFLMSRLHFQVKIIKV